MSSPSSRPRWLHQRRAVIVPALAMCLSALLAIGPVQAREEAAATVASSIPAAGTPAITTLVPFNSEEGMAMLARASARQDFAALANQFEPQSNIAFCGPTSAAIVLNALQAGRADLPVDRSRLQPEDTRHLPPMIELAVPRHTQESVLSRGHKTRAQVLGQPVNGGILGSRDPGFQLRQLDETLRAHGARTRLVIVDDARPDKPVRDELIDNLRRAGDYVIVNYKRGELGQKGGAHLSPLAAYDSVADAFLVMDVNPAAAGWVWVPASLLIKAMRTFDTVENRGYILVW